MAEYRTPFILTDAGRYCDLMKQGFMKARKAPKAVKVVPVVSCYGCMNWHRQGKHIVPDAIVRRANFKAYCDNQRRVGRVAPRKMEAV